MASCSPPRRNRIKGGQSISPSKSFFQLCFLSLIASVQLTADTFATSTTNLCTMHEDTAPGAITGTLVLVNQWVVNTPPVMCHQDSSCQCYPRQGRMGDLSMRHSPPISLLSPLRQCWLVSPLLRSFVSIPIPLPSVFVYVPTYPSYSPLPTHPISFCYWCTYMPVLPGMCRHRLQWKLAYC
ncbi:hypothetical protein J3A83DRAFT_177492 [Scleroderma citrinum]